METLQPGENFTLVQKRAGESLPKDVPGSFQPGAGHFLPKPKNCRWLLQPVWVWEAFMRRWRWALAMAIGLTIAGVTFGYNRVQERAMVRFAWQGNSARVARPNLQEFIPSTDLLQRIASASGQTRTAEYLGSHLEVSASSEPESIEARLFASTPAQALEFAALYAREVLRDAEEAQSRQTEWMTDLFKEKLHTLDNSLVLANRRLAECLQEAGFADLEKGTSGYLQQHEDLNKKLENMRIEMDTLDLQISNLLQLIIQHHPALMGARRGLEEGLLRYTEEHPKIQEYRRNIRLIEARIAEKSALGDPEIALTGSSLAQGLYAKVIELRTHRLGLGKQWEESKGLQRQLESKIAGISDKQLAYVKAKSEYDALREAREVLMRKREENQMGRGVWRITQGPQWERGAGLGRWQAGALWGAGAGFLGLVGAGLLLALVEISDRRIRSARDLERITGLPVLARLGELEGMTEAERRAWAFQTLTALQGKLSGSSQEALVCGFISSGPGEGRSTWVRLLAEAARERGCRVLALDFNTGQDAPSDRALPVVLAPQDLTRTALLWNGPVRVEGPTWAWDLERRTQWQEVLEQLKRMENLVVLIELPPASAAEGILLSENVSPLVWLCGRDRANGDTTCKQLEVLRNARGQVVGSLFNEGPRKGRKAVWGRMVAGALALGCLLMQSLAGQETKPLTPAGMSVNSATNLAEWQKRLTLGPGDVLQISMFEHADSVRLNVVIGPDGRLNYLQARDVMAAGFTVDEFRGELEKVLLKFYQPPLRTIVLPQSYRSKKYYVLGNVAQSGVYPLDRPMTVVEGIASAGGFVSVLQRRHSLMMADLSRSFLVRKEASGQFRRMEVNFEGLFLQGDLSQNVALAPDDYLYFPPLDLPEVYVLGEVTRPGVTGFGPGMSAMKAIASAGGFTAKAFRARILIVRGSLNQPKTFVLDGGDVLAAKSLDFKLEARDLVYVARKPWAKAEELLELAITDFLDAAIITYTGRRVGPFITSPVVR